MTDTEAAEFRAQHLYQVFYRDLNLCGCGNPEDAVDLVLDLLKLLPFYEPGHEEQVYALMGHPGAVHMVLSQLDRAGLTDHGGSLHGSWITPKGEWLLAALGALEDFDEMDGAGFPHGGADCEAACWAKSKEAS